MNLHASLKHFNLYFLLFNMFLKLCCNLIEWYKIAVINNKKKLHKLLVDQKHFFFISQL